MSDLKVTVQMFFDIIGLNYFINFQNHYNDFETNKIILK